MQLRRSSAQAQRAIFAVRNYQKPFGHFHAADVFKIFDTMIKPILCYGSQVWGYEYCSTIESVQNKFCRQFLHVRSTTNTCMVLGDCGRLPICVAYFTNCIRYWCKLLTMPSNRFPRQCYLMLKSLDDVGRPCWASKVKALSTVFLWIWLCMDIPGYW